MYRVCSVDHYHLWYKYHYLSVMANNIFALIMIRLIYNHWSLSLELAMKFFIIIRKNLSQQCDLLYKPVSDRLTGWCYKRICDSHTKLWREAALVSVINLKVLYIFQRYFIGIFEMFSNLTAKALNRSSVFRQNPTFFLGASSWILRSKSGQTMTMSAIPSCEWIIYLHVWY